MKLFVRNEDKIETVLLQAVPKVADEGFVGLFGTKGEENTFILEEGFILALEKL